VSALAKGWRHNAGKLASRLGAAPSRLSFGDSIAQAGARLVKKILLILIVKWKIQAVRTLYNLLFPILFALSSPYYFLRLWRRGGWKNGFTQRFGFYNDDIKKCVAGKNFIWLHAVSVGEINLCVELVRTLESLSPQLRFLVSTTTTTGMDELRKKLPDHIAKIYYPVDFWHCARRALDLINPRAVIFVEAEIWPNFIWQATDRHIPLFLVNARISDRSYPRYLKFAFLFRKLFGSFTVVGAQSEDYAARLINVGCQPEKVEVTGNIKFDTAKIGNGKSLDIAGLFAQIGVLHDAQILVGGSTHNGEELMLAKIFQNLREHFPRLFLVVVPRHFERARDVSLALEKCGIKFAFRSKITPATKFDAGMLDCLIVDTTGELMNFYQTATVVFVGKSISAKGGQNPIEPAAIGRATVFGPNMQNFSDVANIFVRGNGVVQVRDAKELEHVLIELFNNADRRSELGATAQAIVRENQGALLRTAKLILQRIPEDLAGQSE